MVKTIPLAVTICNVHITNSLQQSCDSKSKLISPQHNKFKILDGSHQFSRILPKLALLFCSGQCLAQLINPLMNYSLTTFRNRTGKSWGLQGDCLSNNCIKHIQFFPGCCFDRHTRVLTKPKISLSQSPSSAGVEIPADQSQRFKLVFF